MVKSIYNLPYDNCRYVVNFTLEFTTIVRTICFVNSNGWSHTHYTIIVSPTTVYDLSWIEPLIDKKREARLKQDKPLHKKLTKECRAQVRHDCQLWADTLALEGESTCMLQSTKATPGKHQFFQPDNCDRWHLGEWQTRETTMLEGILRGYA